MSPKTTGCRRPTLIIIPAEYQAVRTENNNSNSNDQKFISKG